MSANQANHVLRTQPSLQLVVFPSSQQRSTDRVTLRSLGGGQQVAIGGATGSPLVVNFFASWCPACKKELSADAEVARTGGVRFVGVDTDDTDPALARSLLRQAGATYPVGIGQADLVQSYGAGNLPTTAFVDGRGRIVAIALGAVPQHQLALWVHELATGTGPRTG